MRLNLFALMTLAALTTNAAVLWNQSPPTDNTVNILDLRLADDFVLAQSATVVSIGFWYQAQFETDLSQLAYAIYGDNGGALGSVVTSGTATPTLSVDGTAYFALFSIPALSLGPGTYWLELHAGSSLSDNSGFVVGWAAAPDNATNLALESVLAQVPTTTISDAGFHQFAFQVNGADVPEPGSLTFVGIGMTAAVIRSLRCRRTPQPGQ